MYTIANFESTAALASATYVTGFDKTRLTRTKTEIHFIA